MGLSNNVVIGAIPDAQNDGINIAAINASQSGTVIAVLAATVVAGVAGKRVFVHGMHYTVSATCTVEVQDVSGSSTVNLTGPMTLNSGVPFVLNWENYPHYSCAVGDSLVLSIGGTSVVQLSGRIMYMQG